MVCNYSVGLEKAEANLETSSKFFFSLSMLLKAFPIVEEPALGLVGQ